MKRFTSLCFALLTAIAMQAQTMLPTPRNIEATYKAGTRSTTGAPGPKYWQNTAAYDLQVRFDPVSRSVQGIASIDYANNSPDTLKEIVFKLYPNIFKKGAQRLMDVKAEDLTDGLIIDKLMTGNITLQNTGANSTNFSVRRVVVPPHGSIHFDIQYHYTLNKGSHIRTGEIEPGADFVAYFFPRIAVYDDIDGWNRKPYLGTQEFYNDFCQFNVAITVPKNYVVWCTGDLKNGQDVLADKYYQRLQAAEKSDAVSYIIDSADLARKDFTTDQAELTWRFEAADVTDVAFAVSDHYLWQSTSLVVDPATGRRTRVDAVFNPKHKDYFHVVHDARKTVESMSYRFPAWPYPYSHETVFDGLDQMEYPMMVNDNPVEDRAESIELTDHEIFHTMFPFYMGINETKYGWMDEGWATIGEWLISPMIDSAIVDEYGVAPYARGAGTEEDLPIITLSTQQSGQPFFLNSYPKPAFGYLYIKDMLGDALFTKALHTYIRQWHGKHPMPNDFFYSMNAGAGQNMNWFWKRWFFDGGVPDLAITSVTNSGNAYKALITNKGGKPVPVDLTITFADGSTQKIHQSIAAWKASNATVTVPFNTTKKPVKMELGSTYVPDSEPKDNVWSKSK